MRFESCSLIDDDGGVVVKGLVINLLMRNRDQARRDKLGLWHGTIESKTSMETWPEIAALMIPKTSGGVVTISSSSELGRHVQFEGVSDPPVLRNENFDPDSITECVECGSDFFTDVSMMSGLCPECAHHIYGYPNCFHEIDCGACVLCKWDGSTSDYIQSLKQEQ